MELDINTIQLGATFVIAMGLLRIIEKAADFVISKFKSNGNGNKSDNKQDIRLAVIEQRLKTIEENHLVHIEKWMEKHDEEHRDDRRILIDIALKMGVKLDK